MKRPATPEARASKYAARTLPHVAPSRVTLRGYHALHDALAAAWLAGYAARSKP